MEEKVAPAKKESMMTKKIATSAALAEFMGEPESSRPGVVKAIWSYVKEHDLQDPANKQMIVPDATLAKIIGDQPLKMTALPKALSPHFIKKS